MSQYIQQFFDGFSTVLSLSSFCHKVYPREAFVAGFTHDLGRIRLDYVRAANEYNLRVQYAKW